MQQVATMTSRNEAWFPELGQEASARAHGFLKKVARHSAHLGCKIRQKVDQASQNHQWLLGYTLHLLLHASPPQHGRLSLTPCLWLSASAEGLGRSVLGGSQWLAPWRPIPNDI